MENSDPGTTYTYTARVGTAYMYTARVGTTYPNTAREGTSYTYTAGEREAGGGGILETLNDAQPEGAQDQRDAHPGSGFRVWGLGFRVQCLGFGGWGNGI